jgi:SNF2 family DNA or RNA helicase
MIVTESSHLPYLALFLKQGLGKSKVTLDCAAAEFKRGNMDVLIVISRKVVLDNWAFEESPKHLSIPWQLVYYKAKSKHKVLPPDLYLGDKVLKLLLINDGSLRTDAGFKYLKKVTEQYRCGIVIDESTLIKNPNAQLTKRSRIIGDRCYWKRILSGEPAPKGPVDYYSQYRFLHPDILGVKTFSAFKKIFCEQVTRWAGPRSFNDLTGEFESEAAKAVFEESVKPYTIRLIKEDVLQDLPPKQKITLRYDLDPRTRQIYDNLKNDYRIEFEEAEQKGELTALFAGARITRLHQITSGHSATDNGPVVPLDNGRFDILTSITDERVDQGPKTIVWAVYRHTVDELTGRLNSRYGAGCAVRVYGGMADGERQGLLDKFRSDPKVRFLVTNATSAWGVTLVEADCSIYYSVSYNFEHRDQSEDRIHRIGQQADKVMYYDIVAKDTVDEKILETLNKRLSFSKSVMKGFNEWLL